MTLLDMRSAISVTMKSTANVVSIGNTIFHVHSRLLGFVLVINFKKNCILDFLGFCNHGIWYFRFSITMR
jgi:hypothetical protein